MKFHAVYKIIIIKIWLVIWKNALSKKLSAEETENSILIYDNATCHKTSEIINKCLSKKFKVLTNIPFKSNFNGIEFLFGYFKNEDYKYILRDKKEQKEQREKIIQIIESEKYNKTKNDDGSIQD